MANKNMTVDPRKLCPHHDCRYWYQLGQGNSYVKACHFMANTGLCRIRDEKDCYSYDPRKNEDDIARPTREEVREKIGKGEYII